jgi:ABC-type antimicrobial peptide transport system permease subunit
MSLASDFLRPDEFGPRDRQVQAPPLISRNDRALDRRDIVMSDENAKAAKVAKVHGLSGLGDLCVQDIRFAGAQIRQNRPDGAVLAVVAVLLAVIGIYDVVAFAVSRRTREMGIGSALGASRVAIVRMVLASSTKPVAVGVVIGAAAAALVAPAITRVFANAPVPVDAREPATYVSVAALLVFVSVAAILHPAWRAAHADPIDALRRD